MTIDEALSGALTVRDETAPGANTAPRVGGELELLARLVPMPYSATFGYTPGMLCIFQGRVYECLLATSAGQSPITHGPYNTVQKWSAYAATDVSEVGADLTDKNVGTKLLAAYVEYILASRPNGATPSFQQTTAVGASTDRLVTVAGLQAPSWAEVNTASYVLVEQVVSGKAQVVKLSLENLKVLLGVTSGGGGTPVDSATYRILRVYREVADTATTAPAAPTNLQLITTPSASNLKFLRWVDNSDNETGFRYEWAIGAAGVFNPLGSVGAGATESSGFVEGFNPLLVDRFRVQAYNSAGPSEWTYLTVNPAATARVITGIRARVVLISGTSYRFEIEVLSTVPIDPEFQFTSIDGDLLGGFFRSLSTTFGNQVFWGGISASQLALNAGLFGYGSVEARPAGNSAERSGQYVAPTTPIGSEWVNLLPIT